MPWTLINKLVSIYRIPALFLEPSGFGLQGFCFPSVDYMRRSRALWVASPLLHLLPWNPMALVTFSGQPRSLQGQDRVWGLNSVHWSHPASGSHQLCGGEDRLASSLMEHQDTVSALGLLGGGLWFLGEPLAQSQALFRC